MRLKQLRMAREMTQAGLSAVSGISRVHIARIERGICAPTIDTIIPIAKALGCRIDDLFEEMDERKEATPHAAEAGQVAPAGPLEDDRGAQADRSAAAGAAEDEPGASVARQHADGRPWEWPATGDDDEDLS